VSLPSNALQEETDTYISSRIQKRIRIQHFGSTTLHGQKHTFRENIPLIYELQELRCTKSTQLFIGLKNNIWLIQIICCSFYSILFYALRKEIACAKALISVICKLYGDSYVLILPGQCVYCICFYQETNIHNIYY
jgi:hypothetical protein